MFGMHQRDRRSMCASPGKIIREMQMLLDRVRLADGPDCSSADKNAQSALLRKGRGVVSLVLRSLRINIQYLTQIN
jgi:hypothetical protein